MDEPYFHLSLNIDWVWTYKNVNQSEKWWLCLETIDRPIEKDNLY
jgi:hypothetical protein